MCTFQPRVRATPSVSTSMRTKVEHFGSIGQPLLVAQRGPAQHSLIITIERALQGAKPAIPLVDSGAAFKKASLESSNEQGTLL
jgi:hypothetical protein